MEKLFILFGLNNKGKEATVAIFVNWTRSQIKEFPVGSILPFTHLTGPIDFSGTEPLDEIKCKACD